MKRTLWICGTFLLAGAAWFAGRGMDAVSAQDRKGPPVTPPSEPRTISEPGADKPEVLVWGQDGGGSASANGIIAVTGSYGVGTSVLYVIDTVTRQLAVYEARGGSNSMRRIVLVGARRIDLDLQLEGYNDESEYAYQDLKRLFEQRRPAAPAAGDAKAASGNRR